MKKDSFVRVSRNMKCPICGKHDWCGISYDGETIVCMRVQSQKESANGGWIHKANQPIDRTLIREAKRKKKCHPDFKVIHARYKSSTTIEQAKEFAESIGVNVHAIERIGAAYYHDKSAWGFPMFDQHYNMVGIRLRSGWGKWAADGSNAGLFMNTVDSFDDGIWLVLEGATDTAAALSLNFNAIGRPSCRGQELMLRDYLSLRMAERIIIIPDNDEPKKNGQGNIFYPGIDGAKALVKKVAFNASIVMPPYKDFRKWAQAGATKKDIVDYINEYTER